MPNLDQAMAASSANPMKTDGEVRVAGEAEAVSAMARGRGLPVLLLRAIPSLSDRVGGLTRSVPADHRLPDTLAGRALASMLETERSRFPSGETVPFGTSVVAVARKPA